MQIADLVAGAAAALPAAQSDPALAPLAERAARHLHPDCILPDYDVLDLNGDEAPVNWMILEGLASRADAGADPLKSMEAAYAKANVTRILEQIMVGYCGT